MEQKQNISEIVEKIKNISLKDNIPIVREKTINKIIEIINNKKYNSYLEIGTAYGYSISKIIENTHIKLLTSIEKNIENYKIARNVLKNYSINLINDNAFLYTPDMKFDFIFVDGPKSHQEKLVTKYLNFLNKDGTVFIDNIFLKKFDNIVQKTKNQIKLIEKVTNFRN
jgi:predicted O-methyltransferase YrrM